MPIVAQINPNLMVKARGQLDRGRLIELKWNSGYIDKGGCSAYIAGAHPLKCLKQKVAEAHRLGSQGKSKLKANA